MITGGAGKTTKFLDPVHKAGGGEVYVATQQPVVVGVNNPFVELMVPPPFTVHVPPEGAPVCVKVTFPPPIQEFTVVTEGSG